MQIGLYIHLPYCPHRCPYCDFFAQRFEPALAGRLIAAIEEHIRMIAPLAQARSLDQVYLGGGTPSMWPVKVLAGLLKGIDSNLGIREGAEITLEANPGTVSLAKLRSLKQAGFNRLSLGTQSFDEGLLKTLGRRHSGEDTRRAASQAREAGFSNLSLDLIYGLPGQSLGQAKSDVALALELKPDHLSLYELTLNPKTPFGRKYRKGEPPLPAESEILLMERSARELCKKAGLERYEVSNFARPGYECRHNQSTWQGGDYLALGPGAHGHVAGKRWGLVAEVGEYCAGTQAGKEPLAFSEELSTLDQARERIMLGLRTRAGVDLAALAGLLGQDPGELWAGALAELKVRGWAKLNQHRLIPTDAGLDMADSAAGLFF